MLYGSSEHLRKLERIATGVSGMDPDTEEGTFATLAAWALDDALTPTGARLFDHDDDRYEFWWRVTGDEHYAPSVN